MTLDLTMPGLDGLGVLRALRDRADSNIPVVVVSAFSAAHGARAVDALAEGAFDLVPKPTANESLDAFIENLGAKVKLAAASRGPVASVGTSDSHAARRATPADNGATIAPRRSARAAKGDKLVADRHLHRWPARAGRARPQAARAARHRER